MSRYPDEIPLHISLLADDIAAPLSPNESTMRHHERTLYKLRIVCAIVFTHISCYFCVAPTLRDYGSAPCFSTNTVMRRYLNISGHFRKLLNTARVMYVNRYFDTGLTGGDAKS